MALQEVPVLSLWFGGTGDTEISVLSEIMYGRYRVRDLSPGDNEIPHSHYGLALREILRYPYYYYGFGNTKDTEIPVSSKIKYERY